MSLDLEEALNKLIIKSDEKDEKELEPISIEEIFEYAKSKEFEISKGETQITNDQWEKIILPYLERTFQKLNLIQIIPLMNSYYKMMMMIIIQKLHRIDMIRLQEISLNIEIKPCLKYLQNWLLLYYMNMLRIVFLKELKIPITKIK